MPQDTSAHHAFKARLHRFRAWTRAHVPRGLRLALGVVLILGGLVGFLPVLGFWMIPLGVAVAALDVRLYRRWRRRNGRRD
ncbi:MAG: hypothetical protein KDK02_01950 [Rhodobacteraceae bacterium]|nr:hypothetical protein [Paracoccaceae bacterium]